MFNSECKCDSDVKYNRVRTCLYGECTFFSVAYRMFKRVGASSSSSSSSSFGSVLLFSSGEFLLFKSDFLPKSLTVFFWFFAYV